MKIKRFVPTLPVLAAIFVVGCAGFGKRLEPPSVSLAHIEVAGARSLETVFQIDLRVFNTNDVPLQLKGVDCELEINGKKLAQGVSPAPVHIPAFGTELIRMEIYSSMIEMASSIWQMVVNSDPGRKMPPLDYKISGTLRIDGGTMMPGSLPFVYSGQLNLQ